MTKVFIILKNQAYTIIVCTLILFAFHCTTKLSRNSARSKIPNATNSSALVYENIENTTVYPHTIVLAIVVCSPPRKFTNRDEASVLLKSIIISAKLNRIRSVEIYFFFDNVTRESDYFLQKLTEFGHPFERLKLIWHFKSAIEIVPSEYWEKFIVGSNQVKCRNLRLFLSNSLPNVDTILYLDTDILVHGNLADIWKIRDDMDNKQLIGMSSDFPESGQKLSDSKVVPYPAPGAVNSGVLLMNLTRMRQYGWVEKLMNIWFDYEKIQPQFSLDDQARINILLYYNPDLLYRIPCQFNYHGWLCNLNICNAAATNGIQLIHGLSDHFSQSWAFKNIYLAYKTINMTNFNYKTQREFHNHIRNQFEKFQRSFTPFKSIEKYVRTCESVLKRIL